MPVPLSHFMLYERGVEFSLVFFQGLVFGGLGSRLHCVLGVCLVLDRTDFLLGLCMKLLRLVIS